MAEVAFADGTVVGDYKKPYVVAEVNSSHNGNLETALAMIDAAHEAGCPCVKFQSWSADSLYCKSYYAENPIARRIVQKFSMSKEELVRCAAHCRDIGIGFSSTPYSETEVDELLEMGAPFVKIASMEINNFGFLRYIAGKHCPVVLSTGMSDLEEIKKAVKTLRDGGCGKLALLHCISIYPAEDSTIRLNNIKMLRNNFPDCPIGFSDHTLGNEMAIAATAMGAAIIEKHLTLDKSKPGMDNNMAIEPHEMSRLVELCLKVNRAMGGSDRVVSDAELAQRLKMRRSVIARHDLHVGDRISADDLGAKRPGMGIPVDQIENLIGRTMCRDVMADTLLNREDFT